MRNSLPMGDANPDWTIEPAATEGCVYIRNAARPTQYIEWYASKNNGFQRKSFCGYSTEQRRRAFVLQFYLVDEPEPQQPPRRG